MITSRVYALISYFVKYAKAWKSCTFFSRNVFKIGQIADRGLRSRRGVRMCYWLSRNIHKIISDKLKNIYIFNREWETEKDWKSQIVKNHRQFDQLWMKCVHKASYFVTIGIFLITSLALSLYQSYRILNPSLELFLLIEGW